MTQIPSGWSEVTLDQVAEWSSGGTPRRSNLAFYDGDIPWIKTGELGPRLLMGSEETISIAAVGTSGVKIFPKGSVAVAMYGATIGKTSILGIDAATNQACAVGVPFAVSSEFLHYFLHAQEEAFRNAGKGGAQPNISQGIVKTWPITLPPLNEQARIVEKLDELLSELDAGVEELKAAQAKLSQYRQSLLKTAVEGELTAAWRQQRSPDQKGETGAQLLKRVLDERRRCWEAEQLAKFEEQGKKPPKGWQAKYPEPAQPDVAALPKLPEGWVWATIDQCALNGSAITDGPFGSNLKSSHYQDSGPRVIRLQNIGEGEFIDARAYISESHYKGLLKHAVEANDVVVAMLGETLPRACKIPPDVPPAIVKADCARVRLNSGVLLSEILVGYLNSAPVRRRVIRHIKGIGRPRINLNTVRGLPIPVCGMDEQHELLRLLSAAQEAISDQHEAIEAAMKRSEMQRQNILRAAFFGQLVPQDPTDEPASKLLERIRAERAAQPKRSGGRRSKKPKEPIAVAKKLIEVLSEANDWLSAQEAFQRAGVADGAQTEEIEELYGELRELDQDGRLQVEPVTDSQGRKVSDRLKLVAG